MKILLDTHIFLWYTSADAKLPVAHRLAIRNPANSIFLSSASVWEAVIKHTSGKLSLPAPAADYLPRQRVAHGIEPLEVDEGAMAPLASLPPLHRDPFDRMLIAQTLQHGMKMASADPEVLAYPVPTL